MDTRTVTGGTRGIALAAVAFGACVTLGPVESYFAEEDLSYPLHVNPVDSYRSTLVCPGCEEPERLAPEYDGLRQSGLEFVETSVSVDYLRKITDGEAEAFLVADVYLFEDPPGSDVGLAVDLSVFKPTVAQKGEIYTPHESHVTASGPVLEQRNTLILQTTEGGWEYRGWVF